MHVTVLEEDSVGRHIERLQEHALWVFWVVVGSVLGGASLGKKSHYEPNPNKTLFRRRMSIPGSLLELEVESRDLLKPSKPQLWMMLAEWVSMKPGLETEIGATIGAVLIKEDGSFIDFCCGTFIHPRADETSNDSCSHALADLVCKYGRTTCMKGSLYLSSGLFCSLCSKLIIQSGVARVIQNLPQSKTSVAKTKSGSQVPSGSETVGVPNVIRLLFQHASCALHEFCLDTEAKGECASMLQDLSKLLSPENEAYLAKEDLSLKDAWFLGNLLVLHLSLVRGFDMRFSQEWHTSFVSVQTMPGLDVVQLL